MNAAVQFEVRGLDQYERAALRRELSRWGAFMDRRAQFNGYPSADNVQRSITGKGGGIDGHRVLCLDFPDGIYPIHARVMGLPTRLLVIVETMHVNIMDGKGGILSREFRCKRAGLTEREGKSLYTQALMSIAGIP